MQALGEWVDRADSVFEQSDWEKAVEGYEAAARLYRGEFLPEDRYTEWSQVPRREMQEMYIEMTRRLATSYARLGRLRQAISCCQRILTLEPHHEAIIRRLMQYHYENGQRTKALHAFSEGKRALLDRLDAEPSEETLALLARIQGREAPDKLDPRRIAVLPFTNFSADLETDYLADGLTEELIGHLAKVRDLRVIARTSVMRFRNTEQPISSIATALSSGTILEGSVRRQGDQIRVCAQLIDARTEEHMWSSEYDRDARDVLQVQEDVARAVTSSLKLSLFRDEQEAIAARRLTDPKAMDYYLQGRQAFGMRGVANIAEAAERFRQALKIDPHHELAQVGLADCILHQPMTGNSIPRVAWAEAARMLEGVLAEHPDLPQAHASMGFHHLIRQGAFDLAEESLRRAIDLAPSNAQAHDWYAHLLMWTGRFAEATAAARVAMDQDPLTPQYAVTTARTLLAAGDFDEADRIFAEVQKLNPANSRAPFWRALSHMFRWNWGEAADEIARYAELNSAHPYNEAYLRCQLGLWSGALPEAAQAADRMVELQLVNLEPRASLMMGSTLVQRGEAESAAVLLSSVVSTHGSDFGTDALASMRLELGLALERLGRFQEAVQQFESAGNLFAWRSPWLVRWDNISGDAKLLARIGAAIGRSRLGDPSVAQESLRQLRKRGEELHTAAASALLCFHLEEIDEGYEWLNKAVSNHDRMLLTIKTHPWYDAARDDPRFADVLARMNLAS